MGQEQVRILIVEAASFMTMGPAHNPSPHLLGRASPALDVGFPLSTEPVPDSLPASRLETNVITAS